MIAQSVYPGDPRIRREMDVPEKSGYIIDIICLRKGNQFAFVLTPDVEHQSGHDTCVTYESRRKFKFYYTL